AVEWRVQRRNQKRLPECAQRSAALMMAAQPGGHVSLRRDVGACRDQRASHANAIERGQVRIASEARHQVERRGKRGGAQVRWSTLAREHRDLESRLDVERI